MIKKAYDMMHFAKIYSMALLLCAAFLAASCGREPEPNPGPEPSGPQAMRFGVSSLETRSNVILSKDDITSMGVFGYTTAANVPVGGWAWPANLLANQKVSKVGGDWIYNPVAYWPVDLAENNTFFAYSPHSTEFAPDSYVQALVPDGGGPPTLRYTLPANVVDHRDILYAKGVYNVNLESPQVRDGMVKYEMEHALSWFAFVLNPADVAGDTGETYSVCRLAFKSDNLPQASLLNLETGVWATPTTYGHVEWELLLDPSKANNVVPGEPKRLTDESNRIMLLPFDLQRGTTSIDLTYHYNPSGPSYDTSTGELFGSEYSYSLPVPATEMKAGKVVVYLINISPEGAFVEFKGDNLIEEWISGGERGGGSDPGGWIQLY